MKFTNKGMNDVKYKIKEMIEDETGMGVIEVILIILVLVGLALVFKNQINSIASGIFSSIKGQVNSF
jgi:hypothetical protein